MKRSGTGCITDKGQAIALYCKTNTVALPFTNFYFSEYSSTLDVLTDSSSIFDDMTAATLETTFGSSAFYNNGPTTYNDSLFAGDATVLPLLCSLPSNAFVQDVNLKTIFITVTDPVDSIEKVFYTGCFSYSELLDILVVDASAISVGEFIINNGNGAVGEVMGKSTNTLSIDMQDTNDFAAADSIDDVATGTVRLTLDAVTSYAVGDTITGDTSGASAVITNKDVPNKYLYVGTVTGGPFQVEAVDTATANITVADGQYLTETTTVTTVSTSLTDSTILTHEYISGTQINMRINLRYTSGFPDDISFINTQIIEINEHNFDATSHSTTHLAIAGTNSPTTDIDWDDNKIENLADGTVATDAANCGVVQTYSAELLTGPTFTEAQAYINALPKTLNHNIEIVLNASSTGFDTNSLVISGFSGVGGIYIDGAGLTTEAQGIFITDCNCVVTIQDFSQLSDGSVGYCLNVDNSRNIYASTNTFKNCDYICHASNNSYINFTGNTIGTSVLNGMKASNNSAIDSENWTATNTITNEVFISESSTIKIIDENQPMTAGSNYQLISEGGQIIGILGSGRSDTDITFVLDTTAKFDNSQQILKNFGPEIPEGMTFNIDFSGTTSVGKDLVIDGFYGLGTIEINGNGATSTIKSISIQNCKCAVYIDDVWFNTSGSLSLSISNSERVYLNGGKFVSNDDPNTIEIDNSNLTVQSTPVIAKDTSAHSIFMSVNWNSTVISGAWSQPDDAAITALVFDVDNGGRVLIGHEDQPYSSAGIFSDISSGGDIIGLLGRNQSIPYGATPTFTITKSISTSADFTQAEVSKIFNAYGREIPAGTIFRLELAAATFTQASDITIGSVYGAGTLQVIGATAATTHVDDYGLIFDRILCKLEISEIGVREANDNGIQCLDCSDVYVYHMFIDKSTSNGIYLSGCPKVEIASCTIEENVCAISAANNSNVYSYSNTYAVDANGTDFESHSGSKIAKGVDAVSSPLTTSSTTVDTGGMIISNTGTVIT